VEPGPAHTTIDISATGQVRAALRVDRVGVSDVDPHVCPALGPLHAHNLAAANGRVDERPREG